VAGLPPVEVGGHQLPVAQAVADTVPTFTAPGPRHGLGHPQLVALAGTDPGRRLTHRGLRRGHQRVAEAETTGAAAVMVGGEALAAIAMKVTTGGAELVAAAGTGDEHDGRNWVMWELSKRLAFRSNGRVTKEWTMGKGADGFPGTCVWSSGVARLMGFRRTDVPVTNLAGNRQT